ncbi:hypothetical protein GCM10007362_49980 [Saccharibacillus endophyticus]|uniref:Uncharacterized protein n=1 Tax=Saccharibacillus endophyticus TaxID=2060666 RepID=A0ABQ2A7F5_9BACL|nr:hypothetical protein GCM10007362_49980 [Saccharibacillus endophyticus]
MVIKVRVQPPIETAVKQKNPNRGNEIPRFGFDAAGRPDEREASPGPGLIVQGNASAKTA